MPKSTSNAQLGQVMSEIWPSKVFASQNSCGRAQTGPVRAHTHAGCVQTGPESEKTLEGQVSLKTHVGGRRRVLVARRRMLVERR